MNDFFDKLGAAARRAADTVSNEVSIAAQEQKIREAYQVLGKLYYKAKKEGLEPAEAEAAEQCDRIDACMKRIAELRENKKVTVEVTAEETDFVTVEE